MPRRLLMLDTNLPDLWVVFAVSLGVQQILRWLIPSWTYTHGGSGAAVELTRFDVKGTMTPAVAIEGRHTGLYARLLRLRNIDPVVSLTLITAGIAFRSASLMGQRERAFGMNEVIDPNSGDSRPLWLLHTAIVLTMVAVTLTVFVGIPRFLLAAYLFAALACGAAFASGRSIYVEVHASDGRTVSVFWKPGRGKAATIEQAQFAEDRIRQARNAAIQTSGNKARAAKRGLRLVRPQSNRSTG